MRNQIIYFQIAADLEYTSCIEKVKRERLVHFFQIDKDVIYEMIKLRPLLHKMFKIMPLCNFSIFLVFHNLIKTLKALASCRLMKCIRIMY